MTQAKQKKLHGYLIGLIAIIALYAVFYSVYYFGEEVTECFTETICLSSKQSILAFTAIQGTFILLLIAIMIGTFKVCFWLLNKGYMIRVGGGLILILGIVGLFVFYKFVPSDEQKDFIHIAIIIAFAIFGGSAMLYTGFRKKS